MTAKLGTPLLVKSCESSQALPSPERKTKGKRREKNRPTISFKMERNHMKTGSCEILWNIRVFSVVSKKKLVFKAIFYSKKQFFEI